MRALVTGAGGFVGANLVRTLLASGDQPEAIVRPGSDLWRLDDVRGDLPLISVDLGDADALAGAVLERRPEVLFHLAGCGGYPWQQDLDAMLSVNVRATETLLAAARAVDARVVHAGSSSEYGHRDGAASELDRLEPNSHYAVTKAAATHLCRLAAATYRQVAVTLRLYSIYGPWEDPRRLMPTLVRTASDGHWPPLVAPNTVTSRSRRSGAQWTHAHGTPRSGSATPRQQRGRSDGERELRFTRASRGWRAGLRSARSCSSAIDRHPRRHESDIA
ncbi:MAG: NAD-dependent epimerase/dehydratase family protein [Actinobacteria bacterium]|nr:MAG: NAD-dependent epimerase/dehydratase family protein [Actinomycetota bacterium]